MCGEKKSCGLATSNRMGSPPRVRGEARYHAHLERITPACAGRSSLRVRLRVPVKDHPRVCGEKSFSYGFHLATFGSPPRVRGEARGHAHLERKPGITPACAGRSHHGKTSARRRWDHPRVCGEKGTEKKSRIGLSGSPPRVRGEVVYEGDLCNLARITPACAGRSAQKERNA